MSRFIGWCLVGFIGLIPNLSFAATQNEAVAQCNAYADSIRGIGTSRSPFNIRCSEGAATEFYQTYVASGQCQTQILSPTQGFVTFTGTLFITTYNCTTGNEEPGSPTESPDYAVSNFPFVIDENNPNQCTTNFIDNYGLKAQTANGSGAVCDKGCGGNVAVGFDASGGGFFTSFSGTGVACVPNSTNTPVPPDGNPNIDTDGDGIPDSLDRCPKDPTDSCELPDGSRDSDGDGVPDYDSAPGGNGPNAPGSGEGGEGDPVNPLDKLVASGGGACITPPSCTGNTLFCNMLYQQWAARCQQTGMAGEKPDPSNGNGGTGNAALGEKLDQLHQDNLDAWRGGDDIGPGSDGNFSDILSNRRITVSDLDTGGFGFPRSCPQILSQDVNFSVMGAAFVIPISQVPFCDVLVWLGYLIVAFASYGGVMILLKGVD